MLDEVLCMFGTGSCEGMTDRCELDRVCRLIDTRPEEGKLELEGFDFLAGEDVVGWMVWGKSTTLK